MTHSRPAHSRCVDGYECVYDDSFSACAETVMVMSVRMYDDSFTACARLCGWL